MKGAAPKWEMVPESIDYVCENHVAVVRVLASVSRRRGFTQRAIAEALGLSRGEVSHWQSLRHHPKPEDVMRWAKLIGVQVEYRVKVVP